MGLSRPGWSLRWLRTGFPDLKAPNLASGSTGAPTFKQALESWIMSPLPTWEEVRWVRELWSGSLVIKGIPIRRTLEEQFRRALMPSPFQTTVATTSTERQHPCGFCLG
jgi:hypothetical protein